jgi:hypothetical protein
MSGMLGAMAISSVKASRQAEGGGGAAGAACSAGSPGVCFLAPDLSGSAAGASAGRALGNGTDAGSAVRLSFGPRPRENSLPASSDQAPDFRATATGAACAQNISRMAATVTIGLSPQARPSQGHLRLAFCALKFMAIP